MKHSYTYQTILNSSQFLYKEKGSKFFGYAFEVANEEEVKKRLAEIREKHSDARHHCYAYRLGLGNEERYRANDDGEPTNSAGKPIYGQLLSAEVTNVLVVVVRYFGGVKLGVGGLISAYKITTKETLDQTKIIEKEELNYYQINFEYPQMSEVMSFVKLNRLEVTNQVFEVSCFIQFKHDIPSSQSILSQLEEIENVTVNFLKKE
ncbi:MAG: YigZ family protein [Flavobacteriales bacterium]